MAMLVKFQGQSGFLCCAKACYRLKETFELKTIKEKFVVIIATICRAPTNGRAPGIIIFLFQLIITLF